MGGAVVPLVVFVDNQEIARLTSNKSCEMTVTPGTHRIECIFLQRPQRDAAQEFNVPAGGRLVVTVSMSRISGTPQFEVAVGD